MRQNLSVSWDTINQYATDLFTDKAVDTIKNHNKNSPMFMILTHLAPHTANEYDPMQAPDDEIDKFNYIKNKHRRIYAAMVSKLDESVGRVVKALNDNDMLDNSIVLFLSDNGSPVVGRHVLKSHHKFCFVYVDVISEIQQHFSFIFAGEHANSGSNFPFKGVSALNNFQLNCFDCH